MNPTQHHSGTGAHSSLQPIMTTLRISLHVMFALLLLFAVVSVIAAGDDNAVLIVGLSALLALVYVIGTATENRQLKHPDRTHIPSWQPKVWLGVVIGLWVALLCLSINFVWLLFPLVFLILHILTPVAALLLAGITWAVAAFLPRFIHPESWNVANAFGPLIGVVFAVGVYFTYVALGKEVAKQEALTAELIAAQQQLAVTEHQSGRMEERERLSREIHDTVAQGLSSILLLSRAAKKDVSGGNVAKVETHIATIEEQAQASLQEARRFVSDLASPDLNLPLDQAILAFIERTTAKEKSLGNTLDLSLAAVDHDDHEALAQLPEPVSRALYRVITEAITNVVKHAHATKAVVTLSMWDKEISVDIADNGTGGAETNANGFGIDGMRRRIDNLGGTFTIESGEAGTIVTATLPLTSQGDHP